MSKAPAVDYALQIIEFFASENRELGISDVSHALSINKNAVSRILESLTEKNWLYVSDDQNKKWRFTLKPFSIMTAAIENQDIVRIAEPAVSRVRDELGDSVYLGIKNGDSVQYLLHYDSTMEVRISGRVGGMYPLNCSAPGKILLSYSDASEVERFFSCGATSRTGNTITDAQTFAAEAQRIRAQGYALDNEEFANGILCIALPVFNHKGEAVASVGISSLTIYDNVDSLISKKYPVLKHATDEISASLGYGIFHDKYTK